MPDYYQTFFRNYDAALGRFIAVDPMPESAEGMTGYNYAGNNPVINNDPMGNYVISPLSQNFNQQVGNMWTDPGMLSSIQPSNSEASGFAGGSGGGVDLSDADQVAQIPGAQAIYRRGSFGTYDDITALFDYADNGGSITNGVHYSYGVDMHGNLQYKVPYGGSKNYRLYVFQKVRHFARSFYLKRGSYVKSWLPFLFWYNIGTTRLITKSSIY